MLVVVLDSRCRDIRATQLVSAVYSSRVNNNRRLNSSIGVIDGSSTSELQDGQERVHAMMSWETRFLSLRISSKVKESFLFSCTSTGPAKGEARRWHLETVIHGLFSTTSCQCVLVLCTALRGVLVTKSSRKRKQMTTGKTYCGRHYEIESLPAPCD